MSPPSPKYKVIIFVEAFKEEEIDLYESCVCLLACLQHINLKDWSTMYVNMYFCLFYSHALAVSSLVSIGFAPRSN